MTDKPPWEDMKSDPLDPDDNAFVRYAKKNFRPLSQDTVDMLSSFTIVIKGLAILWKLKIPLGMAIAGAFVLGQYLVLGTLPW